MRSLPAEPQFSASSAFSALGGPHLPSAPHARVLARGWVITAFALVLLAVAASPANAALINFEGYTDDFGSGEPFTVGLLDGVAVPGAIFSNSIALTAGVSLFELEFPPRSGVGVAGDDGGPMLISFPGTIISFSGYFTYSFRLLIEALDESNSVLGSVTSDFGTNLALSGEPGSDPNEFLLLAFPDIRFIRITGDQVNGFVVDDIEFVPAQIPEPATALILTVGVAAVVRRRLKVRRLSVIRSCDRP